MKKPQAKLLGTMFCIFCTATTPYVMTKQSSQQTSEQTIIVELSAQVSIQFRQLENIAQHLAQLIASKQCRPRNPQEAQAWLLELTLRINRYCSEQNTTVTPEMLYKHMFFIERTVWMLEQVVKNNFATLPLLIEDSFTNKALSSTEDYLATLAEKLIRINRSIQNLEKMAANAGLSGINKIYRKITGLDTYGLFLPTVKIGGSTLALGSATALFTALILQIKSFDDFKNINSKFDAAITDRVRDQLATAALTGTATALFGWTLSSIRDMLSSLEIGEKLSIIHSLLKGTKNKITTHAMQYIYDTTLDDPLFDGIREDLKPLYDILEFLKDPVKYTSTNMNISKSILLYGPSGCGKSFAAKAFAGSVNRLLQEMGQFKRFGFIEVEPYELQNWGGNVVQYIFEKAEGNAPCVIFLDEFHLADGGLQVNSNHKLLNEFLKAFDELAQNNDPQKQIFIIAATNRVELLDQALIREGRLGCSIKFSYPNYKQRIHLLKQLCEKSAIDTSSIDFEFFAQLTKGTSYSDLNYMFVKAAFIAKNQAQAIRTEHLYQALNENIRKVRKTTPLSDYEQNIVAAHIAGQSLGYYFFEHTNRLESATILPAQPPIVEKYDWQVKEEQADTKAPREDKQKLSHGAVYYCDQSEELSQEPLETQCKHCLSGLIAQKVLCSQATFETTSRQDALLKAQEMLLDGVKLEDLSKTDQNTIKSEAYHRVQSYEQEITDLFEKHKDKLKLLHTTLLDKKFLQEQEIQDALGLK